MQLKLACIGILNFNIFNYIEKYFVCIEIFLISICKQLICLEKSLKIGIKKWIFKLKYFLYLQSQY